MKTAGIVHTTAKYCNDTARTPFIPQDELFTVNNSANDPLLSGLFQDSVSICVGTAAVATAGPVFRAIVLLKWLYKQTGSRLLRIPSGVAQGGDTAHLRARDVSRGRVIVGLGLRRRGSY